MSHLIAVQDDVCETYNAALHHHVPRIGLVATFGDKHQWNVSEMFKQETGPSHPNDWIGDEYKVDPALEGCNESEKLIRSERGINNFDASPLKLLRPRLRPLCIGRKQVHNSTRGNERLKHVVCKGIVCATCRPFNARSDH
jgi:hypothetical protein